MNTIFFLVLYGAITFDPACSPEPYKQITIKGRFSNYTQEKGFDIAWALKSTIFTHLENQAFMFWLP